MLTSAKFYFAKLFNRDFFTSVASFTIVTLIIEKLNRGLNDTVTLDGFSSKRGIHQTRVGQKKAKFDIKAY